MKLTILFIVVSAALHTGATNKCPQIIDSNQETPPGDGIPGNVLKMLQARFDFIDRKMLDLEAELKEQREEIGRNFSLLHDRSKSDTPKADSTTPARLTEPTTTPKPKGPASCKEVPSNVSGVYLIDVGSNSAPFQVYCEMEKLGGGWIVVQHRFNGSVDFYRNWDQYRDGFGELDSEFWLGLEKMHQITKSRNYELVVEIKDFSEKYGYARYDGFQIGSENEEYRLKTLGSYSGSVGNAMLYYNKGMKFSTKDRDNDASSSTHCAQDREGAWWYGECTYANLNGRYRNAIDMKSMNWFLFQVDYNGLSYSRMMIREL
ncbi:angiopoietin-related protein 1-like [Anopheles albimanus]|uniref:Fibrinogen C-terminal domain-containing protein n=1 Tax=Anopheles albimanus TaxID=7167 RepID=A0A8W7JBV1_ANOAL|nr:angiopoietin-related protein 1-like [Anopheles albimanus]